MTSSTKVSKHQFPIKFALLLLLFIGYFSYLSYEYDLATGGIASMITWSFFVLCTPIADAGFLLDFPIRLITGIRMIVSEIAVWTLAITINVVAILYFPDYYSTTTLTKLLYEILTTPYPYYGVILLSLIGTFLSLKFGDELMDVIHHHERDFFHKHNFTYELLLLVFFVGVLVAYFELISSLGIEVVS
ncbi:MAG: hypothetical protein COA74_07405 [Gammaproteobacteria bacterium]|nr:MAG: hypothetical protein COA74_07405 [Gammaproteobacteria bacterium]